MLIDQIFFPVAASSAVKSPLPPST